MFPAATDDAAALVAEWQTAATAGGELPDAFARRAQALHSYTSGRDHPDVQRTFPLKTIGPFGAWFEGLPLDVTPRMPEGSASPGVRRRVERLLRKWRPENTADLFDVLFEPKEFERLGEDDRRHSLWLGFILGSLDQRPWARDALYEGARRPDPEVRALILSLAYLDLPWPPAEEVVYRATHDTDEMVFLPAFRICGRRHDERAMDHLLGIVAHPSAVLSALSRNRMQYPVGHAACSICPGQFAILGTDDPDLAAAREAHLLTRVRRPLSVPIERARPRLYRAIEVFVPPEPIATPPADLDDMILIRGGPFRMGVDPGEVPMPNFDWSTCMPARRVEVPDFHIDRYPVTNQQYDDFCEMMLRLAPSERRRLEHPGQPEGKPHRRNTRGDPRFGPDHPVVGIDWFDAFAYARWRGKQLPTETQWEKAARGDTGSIYPWGNEFDPAALRSAGETYGAEPPTLLHWVMLLSRGTHEFPARTTAPVDAHPAGASPYGVQDMCGNAWEFTRTCFSTRQDARPAFANFDPVELMATYEGQVVIKGGAWSSPAPLIGAAYRGYDLLTDRHTEIGFRCVFEPQQTEGTRS